MPDRQLEDLEELFRVARQEAARYRVELYARTTVRLRVRAERHDEPVIVETGRDQGLAARIVDGRGRTGFAAASGIDRGALHHAVTEAVRSPGEEVERPWHTGGGAILRDHGDAVAPPDADALEAWLLAAAPAARPVWVEHGRTIESIVADGGLRASRARSRVWAVGQVPDASGEERPRMVAGRALDDLEPGLMAPRSAAGGSPASRSAFAALPAIVEPAAAAILVHALIHSLCGPEGVPVPVGSGFSVFEDPVHPRGLTGGSFDDAGFQTVAKALTNEGFTAPAARGAGDLRRDSFRDPPRPAFSNLVVADGGDEQPADGVRIHDLRIHAVEPHRWLLEVGGVGPEGGPPFRTYLSTGPAELVRRICGACGRKHSFPNGVLTPALLLEGVG